MDRKQKAVSPTFRTLKNDSPAQIRTGVRGSRVPYDWPLHYGAVLLLGKKAIFINESFFLPLEVLQVFFMAKLRKGSAYNKEFKRPYTRKSKYRKKDFVRGSPHSKVIRYEMGNLQKQPGEFEYTLTLVTKKDLQIRHNALESARQSGNRVLEKYLGKSGFRMQLRKFPHHLLRENALASGAGADRMSTGMAASFGKTVGLAAQVKAGEAVFVVSVDKTGLKYAKEGLTRCKNKLPCRCQIFEVKNK